MPINRTKSSINRTLLILLGIILACLLTLNARSFYSADSLSFPTRDLLERADSNVGLGLMKDVAETTIKGLLEKVSSLN